MAPQLRQGGGGFAPKCPRNLEKMCHIYCQSTPVLQKDGPECTIWRVNLTNFWQIKTMEPSGVHKALHHCSEQACFIAISSCFEPSQTHAMVLNLILVIHSFYMLKCLGIEILWPISFKATTGGIWTNFLPPVVALKDIIFLKSGYWIFGVKMGDINFLKLGYWDIGPPTAGPYYFTCR